MFTEESFENVVIQYLKELNYDYIHGSNLTSDNKEVLLLKNLKTSLININKEIPESSIDYAIKKIQNFETNDVFTNNKLFHKYLTEGIEITDSISHSKTNRIWQHQKQRISSSQPTRNSRRWY